MPLLSLYNICEVLACSANLYRLSHFLLEESAWQAELWPLTSISRVTPAQAVTQDGSGQLKAGMSNIQGNIVAHTSPDSKSSQTLPWYQDMGMISSCLVLCCGSSWSLLGISAAWCV